MDDRINGVTACNCAAAGFCETFQKVQSPRHHAICRGDVLSPEKSQVYRDNWAKMKAGLIESIPQDGPGKELKQLLEALGIEPTKSCQCQQRIDEMNRLDVDGCRRERERLLGWLRESYDEASVITKLRAAGNALAQGLPLSLEGLLDEAITRATLTSRIPALPPSHIPPSPPRQL